MTEKELFRANIVQQVNDNLITQVKAAEILKLTDRQIRNLLKVFRKEGVKGLISKKRGKRSNRAYSRNFEETVISLVSNNYLTLRRRFLDFEQNTSAISLLSGASQASKPLLLG